MEEGLCSRPSAAHRRALHRIPEVGFDLPETQAYVLRQLSSLNAQVKRVAGNGVLAYFDAGRSETTAFRCDMDALPIQEATDLPFASQHPGRMHACGHDAHMATMLAFCEWLSQHRGELSCNVLAIFQPAEEVGGGARFVVESGALEEFNVRRIFALHVQPGIPVGTLASRPGAFMATACEVHIRLTGASAHAARARDGRDAMLAGAEAVRAVYAFDASLPEDMPRSSASVPSIPARRPTSCPTLPSFPAPCAPSASKTTRASRRAWKAPCKRPARLWA